MGSPNSSRTIYENTSRRYITNKEDRKLETINKSLNAPTASFGNVTTLSQYLGEDNVKAFNQILYTKAFNFNRTAIEDRDTCIKECTEYFTLCNEYQMIPTISSLCLYLGVSTTRLYENISNPNCSFSDVLEGSVKACHMVNEMGALAGKIPVTLFQFLSTNYYGLKNTQQVEIKPSIDKTVDNQETLKVIQEQIASENSETL